MSLYAAPVLRISGVLACVLAAKLCSAQVAKAQPPEFVPAFFHFAPIPDQLVDVVDLFPPEGQSATVAMPPGLGASRVIAFGPEGRSLYVQTPGPSGYSGVRKLDFRPTRWAEVPGTADLGLVRCMAIPDPTRLLLIVSPGPLKELRTFEVSPDTGERRQLPIVGPFVCMDPGLGNPHGFLSPDGKRSVINAGKQAQVLTIESGGVQLIEQSSPGTHWTWSPDGKWLAGIVNDNVILVDSENTSGSRNLGASGDGPITWSPDSTRLLIVTGQMSCIPTVVGRSLQILDVGTGKREAVRGSHCRIVNGTVGWMDREIAK